MIVCVVSFKINSLFFGKFNVEAKSSKLNFPSLLTAAVTLHHDTVYELNMRYVDSVHKQTNSWKTHNNIVLNNK